MLILEVMNNNNLNDDAVYLVDGSGYIFRAFFAIKYLRSKSGMPTNAIFGFTKMLLKLLKEHKPKYVAIAFDLKAPTFRHEIYPAYKVNRPPAPEELIVQFEWIHKIVQACAIKSLMFSGLEADDIIATLAKKAKSLGRKVIVVTGDKDLMQLVDENTFLLDELRAIKNGHEDLIDANKVKETLGVWPNEVIDLLALAGDTSDNIPGVKGVGKKTAQELINQFGSLENIFDNLDMITQKSRQEKLKEGKEMAFLSKNLVSLKSDAHIDYSLQDLAFNGVDTQALKALFTELDFTSLKIEIESFNQKSNFLFKPVQQDLFASFAEEKIALIDFDKYAPITNIKDFNGLVNKLKKATKIALDTETDGLDSMTCNLVGISLGITPNEAFYIPIAHKSGFEQLPISIIREELNKIFSLPIKFVAQNAKFDLKILIRHGFKAFNVGGDSMLANYLLQQDQARHNLDDLSEKFLSYTPIKFVDIVPKDKDFSDLDLETATKYSAEDADLALRLEDLLSKNLQEEKLNNLYTTIELPLCSVLAKMELNGVKIDVTALKIVEKDLKERLIILTNKAYELANKTFNLASPKQVAEILFDELKLNTAKKTKTGFSTDANVLEKLKDKHPLPAVLLEHRMCAKLISTYVETLPTLVNAQTLRVHTNYNQFVTATGRLSSSDPNLQNIPIRTSEGRKIRQAFIAEKDCVLISLDYSQMELRLLAFVTKDPYLNDAFARDQDVHTRVAAEIFAIDLNSVTKEQRSIAKTINFGLLYGMGSSKLAQTLKISTKLAKEYLEKYFSKYQNILTWKNETLSRAKETLEVRTLFGRKRELKDLLSNNPMQRARAERLAINTPIQGSAADIIKKAMIDTDNLLTKSYPDAKFIMQVHDELVIEASKMQAQEIANKVADIMSKGHGLDVYLKVDYTISDNWNS